jgi:hypothetical protein
MKTRMTKVWPALLTSFALLGTAGCDTANLLEVIDPDLVTPDNVQGEKGAELYWAGAIGQFAGAFSSGGGGQALYTGMLSDEFLLSGTFPTRTDVDKRDMDERNGTLLGQYRSLHQARVGLKNAAERLVEFVPGDSRIAEMWNLNGYTYLFFAENYCSGVPFSQTPNEGDLSYGVQTTTAQMLTTAAERFGRAAAATAGSSDQANLAAIGLGRARLNEGDYAGAAAAVASVPDGWTYLVRSKGGGAFGQLNAIYEMNFSQRRWSLSDMEGGNGIAWRSVTDSRVPWEDAGEVGFDSSTPLFHQLKFSSWDDDVVLASGVEARLIEAENELATGAGAGVAWLNTLNTLRATEGLTALVDPGTPAARVDMLFEERARWMYGTAHRVGDLRRLIRQYGRTESAVFPSGPFFKGGVYGTDVNFPIPFEELENPELGDVAFVCLNRDA